jgi:hypothetical protein
MIGGSDDETMMMMMTTKRIVTAETARKRLKKVRKMRTTIDDEDLALIQEAQQDKEEIPGQGSRASGTPASAAKTEAELSRGFILKRFGG